MSETSHITKVIPHIGVFCFLPDWFVGVTDLIDPYQCCTHIVQTDTYLEESCASLVISNAEWKAKMSERALKCAHAPLSSLTTR